MSLMQFPGLNYNVLLLLLQIIIITNFALK